MKKKQYSKAEKTSWIEAKKAETKAEMDKLIDDLLSSRNVSGFLEKKLFTFPTSVPSHKWSMLNQFRLFMLQSMDCRGYKQWKEVGRQVNGGSKSVHILVPIFKEFPSDTKFDASGQPEKVRYLAYFKQVPVFRVEDTEGDRLDYQDSLDELRALDPTALPLYEIAEALGIPVSYNMSQREYGSYSYAKWDAGAFDKKISLCTDAEQTFYHELSHAIDHELYDGDFSKADQSLKEITAEFSACYLAGKYGAEANMVYTRAYVRNWSGKKPPVDQLLKCLNRAVNIALFIEDKKEAMHCQKEEIKAV